MEPNSHLHSQVETQSEDVHEGYFPPHTSLYTERKTLTHTAQHAQAHTHKHAGVYEVYEWPG